MQKMKSVLVPPGQVDGPRRTFGGRLRVPDFGVVRNNAATIKCRRVGPNQGLVFTVGRNGQRGLGKNLFERFLLINQEIARGRTDENFDATCS